MVIIINIKSLKKSHTATVLRVTIVGQRYALQALKLGVIALVRNFRIVECEKTIAEEGLKFTLSKNSFDPGVQFKVEKI